MNYLYHCPTDEDSRSRSLFFDCKQISLELGSGIFHLLMLTHKFPILQKVRFDAKKKVQLFSEAIVLPWDLLVSRKHEEAVPTMDSSGCWRDSLENFTKPEDHHTHKRCKIEQASREASNYGLNDATNGLSGNFNGSCSSYSNSSTENTCVSNHSPELPCLIGTKGVNCHCLAKLLFLHLETVGLPGGSSQSTVATSLIADALQISYLKPMQFQCSVVGVYILVLEKAKTTAVFQPSGHSILSAIKIPFAGFVMDDGSSSCCCWADSESAAALLGPKDDKGPSYSSTIIRLNQILEKHSRVVVKNCGSIYDPSCQELPFSVDPNRLITSSDEDILTSLIVNASSPTWSIVGSVVDPKTNNGLEERMNELDIAVPPLMNIWATRVCYAHMLREGRDIIQELIQSQVTFNLV
ncbi:hypothetical protein CDL12_16164 [Handroanthus impetiginosus]|uniref:CST complex subunit CTC1 n=1 Tax=Handroanthus impetiginosus TaxID=429701 RepID=A0A2G9H138_9LAMI|nr:hypothetical protein CDL12_16164 [Handroanthus impetiginosus]